MKKGKKNQFDCFMDKLVPNPDGTFSVGKLRALPPTETGTKEHKYGAKKVKGANGNTYDSKIEYFMKGQLDLLKIPHVEKKEFVLQEEFTYMGKKVAAIRMIPDFAITDQEGPAGKLIAIVDTKGVATVDWKMKCKMLKMKLHMMNHEVPVYTPSDQDECRSVIGKLMKLTGMC